MEPLLAHIVALIWLVDKEGEGKRFPGWRAFKFVMLPIATSGSKNWGSPQIRGSLALRKSRAWSLATPSSLKVQSKAISTAKFVHWEVLFGMGISRGLPLSTSDSVSRSEAASKLSGHSWKLQTEYTSFGLKGKLHSVPACHTQWKRWALYRVWCVHPLWVVPGQAKLGPQF